MGEHHDWHIRHGQTPQPMIHEDEEHWMQAPIFSEAKMAATRVAKISVEAGDQ
jgi:hypothetical protein